VRDRGARRAPRGRGDVPSARVRASHSGVLRIVAPTLVRCLWLKLWAKAAMGNGLMPGASRHNQYKIELFIEMK